MVKTDCSANTWVSNYINENFDWCINSTADCEENFQINDIDLSATTKSGELKYYPIECKTIKGGFTYHNNTWFNAGIRKKSILPEDIDPEIRLYILNENKYKKLIEASAVLIYLFPDGMLMFSPKTLKKAFVCYGQYLNKAHTEEFGEGFNPHYETKAFLDMNKGCFVECDPPKELFEK